MMTGAKRERSTVWRKIQAVRFEDIKAWCMQRLPILKWVPVYNWKESLVPDTVSGMMLAIQQVTQGLAFAALSSVHPVFGLYGSFFPVIVYAIFGMGRHVATVERLVPSVSTNFTTNNNSGILGLSEFEMQRIGVAAAVSFLGGIIQVPGLLKETQPPELVALDPSTMQKMSKGAQGISSGLHAWQELGHLYLKYEKSLSKTAVSFYERVVSAVVVDSPVVQIPGLEVSPWDSPYHFINSVALGITNVGNLDIDMMTISSNVYAAVGQSHVRVNGASNKRDDNRSSYTCCNFTSEVSAGNENAIYIRTTGIFSQLNEKFQRDIKVVLPIDLLLIIATSIACYYADMEYVYGLEVVGHIPEGLPSPKTPPMNVLPEVVTEAFGVALVGYVASLALAQGSAKKFKYTVDDNQVACLISCVLILVVIYAIGPMLYWLPMCVLASIIVVGLKGMLMQFRDLKKYWNVDKIDWSIWVSTYVFTICFAANVGLLYGVVCTIVIVIFRFPRYYVAQELVVDICTANTD
ncbi:hypothetical protein BTVI_75391 [Pitangus sulphuratus]|nr:hypothetical protein BTVI_75391 [Pitangus sulphuratus]